MKLSFRILQKDWLDDMAFRRLLASIKRNLDVIDEVMLFVGTCHGGYDSLPQFREKVLTMRQRFDKLREIGIPSVGCNMWSTLGHVDEAWDWVDMPPFQTVVGHDGHTSANCVCFRDEQFLAYCEKKYALVAEIEPDFIWVDDDVRIHHHQVEYPCFCQKCVQKFGDIVGRRFTRERLVEALEAQDEFELRSRFLEFNRDALNELCRRIGESIRRVNPGIRIGLMTTGMDWNSYALSDQEGMLKALKADMIRPGGGFYNDEQPFGVISKFLSVALQNAYSCGLEDSEWELEDFPVCWNKSAHMHQIEITGALMSGCSDITLNSILPNDTQKLMDGLRACRSMWDHMSNVIASTTLRGYCPVFIPGADAAALSSHSIFSHDIEKYIGNERSLVRLGVSYTPVPENASFCAVSGDMMAAIPDDSIPALFSRGVIMDAEALSILIKRGYGELAGCSLEKAYHNGLYEVYLPHSINGDSAGVFRDVFMTFWDRDGITVYTLKLQPGAEALSELYSITGTRCGIGSCVFENRLGGRVAVCSYFPWRFLETPGKATTAQNLFRYLANDRLPVEVSGGTRVVPLVRTKPAGDGFIAYLINASYDATDPLKVRVESGCGKLTVYNTRGEHLERVGCTVEDGYTVMDLPELGGWQTMIIIGE